MTNPMTCYPPVIENQTMGLGLLWIEAPVTRSTANRHDEAKHEPLLEQRVYRAAIS